MKKRILSALLVFVMLIGVASATVGRDLRWSYFNSLSSDISMVNGEIDWYGDASSYTTPTVTLTKISVKLQIATQAGWGTVETLTDSSKNDVATGGTYSDWKSGESYRVAVEAWAYNGSKELEHIGPFYDYLYT